MPDSASDAQLPRTGDLVLGRYRIEGTCGRGGMGVVFAVRHEMLGQPAALKVLSGERRDAEAKQRFLHEARAALQIRSNHVVNVKDLGTLESGLPFVLMELLEGRDVAQILKANGPLPIAQAVDYCVQALEALSAAHAVAIVHRDLKPSNLFVTTMPNGPELLKVLGFGMAPTQAPQGVALYMSPEQLKSEPVDARTDIWAIGVILHELLTGATPFTRETFGAIVDQPLVPITDRRPDVPAGLEAIIFRCLERDPAARFADVAELARALATFGTALAQAQLADIEANLALPPPPTTLPGGHGAPPDEAPKPLIPKNELANSLATTVMAMPGPDGPRPPRPDVAISSAPDSERTLILTAAEAAARNLPPPDVGARTPLPPDAGARAPLPPEGVRGMGPPDGPPPIASSGPPGGPPPIGPGPGRGLPPPGYVSPSAPGAWISPRTPVANRTVGLLAIGIGGALLVLIVGGLVAARAISHRRAASLADAGPAAAASAEPGEPAEPGSTPAAVAPLDSAAPAASAPEPSASAPEPTASAPEPNGATAPPSASAAGAPPTGSTAVAPAAPPTGSGASAPASPSTASTAPGAAPRAPSGRDGPGDTRVLPPTRPSAAPSASAPSILDKRR